jgi:hypothetical protein
LGFADIYSSLTGLLALAIPITSIAPIVVFGIAGELP